MTKYTEFARWLRIKLAELNWKGSDLQRACELEGYSIASATISKWRKGQVQPSRENCALLADVLNTPVEDILRLVGHEPLESAGPLSGLSKRIAQIDPHLGQIAARQIEAYGDQFLDRLQVNALQETGAEYSTIARGLRGNLHTRPLVDILI